MRYTRPVLEGLADGPLYWLGGYARVYPDAWRDIERLRAQSGRSWPPYIYAPIGAVQQFVRPGQNIHDLPWEDRMQAVTDATALAALAAWRMTKGIYNFDPALAHALQDTPITGSIPVNVLQNLPEWCVYLPLNLSTPMGRARGAWAHFDLDPRDNRLELRLLVELDRLLPLVVRLGGTLEDGIREVGESAVKSGLGEAWGLRTNAVIPFVASVTHPVVSMLLYLCSAEPEISGKGRPGNPRPQKTKRGQKVIAVQGVRSWDVGVVLGAALRSAQEHQEEKDNGSEVTGRSVRPHIRRAHWHTYMTGPRDAEQTPILKWLHPTLVNAPDPDDMPAVVRPVK